MPKLFRYAQAIKAFVRLVRDMRRTDEVFEVVDGLDSVEMMQPIADHLRAQPGGGEAFATRPRVGALDLKALIQLPEGTLGRAYAEHMTALGLDPYFFPQFDAKTDLEYLRMSLYETHDIWHVVTGFRTDVAGELGLQAFYAAQLRVGFLPPVLLAAGMLNSAFYDLNDLEPRVDAISRGWQMGRRAQPLFGLPWADMWSMPLDQVRARLGVQPDQSSVASPRTQIRGAAVG